jgi:hypothetical protein
VQEQTLVPIEAISRPLARGGVHPHIGDVVEPLQPFRSAQIPPHRRLSTTSQLADIVPQMRPANNQ